MGVGFFSSWQTICVLPLNSALIFQGNFVLA